MLKTIGVIILFIFIAFFQITKLIKKGLIREIWISLSILTVTTVLTILMVHDISIPNPLDLIAITLDPFIKLFSAK